ncbi:MAG: hypothetical protein ACK5PQ_03900 [Alphaproteobacteria bacterium]
MFFFILTFFCCLFFKEIGSCGAEAEKALTQPSLRRLSTDSFQDLFGSYEDAEEPFEDNAHQQSFCDAHRIPNKSVDLDCNDLISLPPHVFQPLNVTGFYSVHRNKPSKRKKHYKTYEKSGEYRLAKKWLTFINQVTDASLPKNIHSFRSLKPGKERQMVYNGIASKLRSWIRGNPSNKIYSAEAEKRFWDFHNCPSKRLSKLVLVNPRDIKTKVKVQK